VVAGSGVLLPAVHGVLSFAMKRIAVLSVALVLMAPAVALGLTRTLHGPAGPGTAASVDIAFKYRHHHAKVITRFEFNNIPITCAGGSISAVSDRFSHRIRVSSTGKFHATQSANEGRATYKVKGHFEGVHEAVGTLRITGTVPACPSGDTGKVHFSATPAKPGT
jgi:hypothetical protein